MRRFCLICAASITLLLVFVALAEHGPGYHVSKTVKVGGVGTFDTVLADTAGRRLYIPRKGPGRITVFNLDTLEPVGEIPDAAANGAVVDPKIDVVHRSHFAELARKVKRFYGVRLARRWLRLRVRGGDAF